MTIAMAEKPDYSNWVAPRLIYGPAVVGIVFVGLGLIFPLSFLAALIFWATAGYFAYAH